MLIVKKKIDDLNQLVIYYKKVLDGQKIDLVVTDLLYNIDYGRTISWNERDIANDNMSHDNQNNQNQCPKIQGELDTFFILSLHSK